MLVIYMDFNNDDAFIHQLKKEDIIVKGTERVYETK